MSGFKASDVLSFEKLITPRILKIVFFLGLIGLAIAGLVAFVGSFAAMRMSVLTGLGTMVAAVLGTALGGVVWRMACEGALAFFNVHDRVGDIRDRLNALAPSAPSGGVGRQGGASAPSQPYSIS